MAIYSLYEHGGAHRRVGEYYEKKSIDHYLKQWDDKGNYHPEEVQENINASNITRILGTRRRKAEAAEYRNCKVFSPEERKGFVDDFHHAKSQLQKRYDLPRSSEANKHKEAVKRQNELKDKQNKLKSVKEACEYILSVLDEAEKNGIKLKGVPCSNDNGHTEELKDCVKFIESKWNDILEEASDRIFEHSKNIDKYRYKNRNELKKDLKLLFWDFDSMTASKTGITYNLFSLSFDANPPIDKNHLFTLYVTYNPDNNHISYESVYDG